MEAKYVEYAAKLSNATIPPICIIVVSCLAFLVIAILFARIKEAKDAFGCIVCGILISLLTYFTSIYSFQKDIRQNAYISYTGEFFVEDYYAVKGGGEYIILKTSENGKETKYHYLCDSFLVEAGESYYGTIVYTKYSKSLVDIVLSNG